jgi:indole-3-glycerol phosphate synthase
MSGFLDEMARSSAQRVAQAARRESLGALERRARQTPPAPPLRLSAAGFDVIAELKLRSPAAGVLRDSAHDWLGRISAYARGGAAAVSVLTEPSRFDGSLQHLREAAAALAPLGVPAMRKDFIVDPYQVLEARAAGAGGVLIILRMLSRARLAELLEVAAGHGLFVLLEAFDAADLELAGELLDARPAGDAAPSRPPPARGLSPTRAPPARGLPLQDGCLVGVNCRDLQSLEVVPERFAQLASRLPARWPAVAESGVNSAADAQRVRQLGYRVALIGTALMSRDEPTAFLAEIFDASRTVPP